MTAAAAGEEAAEEAAEVEGPAAPPEDSTVVGSANFGTNCSNLTARSSWTYQRWRQSWHSPEWLRHSL